MPEPTEPLTPAARRRRPAIGPRAWALLTVLAGVFLGFVSSRFPAPDDGRAVGLLGATIVAVGVIATGAAARWPVAGITVYAVAIGAYVGRSYPNGPILAAGLLAVFLVGWRADRRRALVAIALVESGVLVGWWVSGQVGVTLLYLGWLTAAAFIGDALRSRRRYREEQRARAASVQRSREAEALARLAEQRLDIARDLHDGVAHAMATINVQAAAAARVIDRRPEAARDALSAIAQASGTVLDELNAVVAVLRDHGRPADLAPTPGLDDLAALVATTSAGPLSCALDIRGDVSAVGAAIGTAAYRIVQESLTNVLRHSDATHATVTVDATGGELAVEVRDDGPGRPDAPSPGAGTGIAGMRERAAATGGIVTAGRAAHGFVVRAEWGPVT